MNKFSKVLLAAASCLALSPFAASAAVVDEVNASSGQAGTFFVPMVGQETDSPYYRGNGDGWGWQHGAIASGFTSANLNVSAYDVDAAPCGSNSCEVNNIEAYDAFTDTWLLLGALDGASDIFSFTDFDIYNAAGGALQDDIEAGLQVRMEIDNLDSGWFVSLSKSVITTDGANAGNPNPAPVPLPASSLLLLAGLGGLAAAGRKKKAS